MRWFVAGFVALVVVFVGYLNTHTDETGILVVSILVLAAAVGFVVPRHTWRVALLVGLAAPAAQAIALVLGMRVPYANNWTDILTSCIALIPAFAGSYVAAAARRGLSQNRNLPKVRQ